MYEALSDAMLAPATILFVLLYKTACFLDDRSHRVYKDGLERELAARVERKREEVRSMAEKEKERSERRVRLLQLKERQEVEKSSQKKGRR